MKTTAIQYAKQGIMEQVKEIAGRALVIGTVSLAVLFGQMSNAGAAPLTPTSNGQTVQSVNADQSGYFTRMAGAIKGLANVTTEGVTTGFTKVAGQFKPDHQTQHQADLATMVQEQMNQVIIAGAALTEAATNLDKLATIKIANTGLPKKHKNFGTFKTEAQFNAALNKAVERVNTSSNQYADIKKSSLQGQKIAIGQGAEFDVSDQERQVAIEQDAAKKIIIGVMENRGFNGAFSGVGNDSEIPHFKISLSSIPNTPHRVATAGATAGHHKVTTIGQANERSAFHAGYALSSQSHGNGVRF